MGPLPTGGFSPAAEILRGSRRGLDRHCCDWHCRESRWSISVVSPNGSAGMAAVGWAPEVGPDHRQDRGFGFPICARLVSRAATAMPGIAPARGITGRGGMCLPGGLVQWPSARFEVVPKCFSDDLRDGDTLLFGALRE